MSASSMPWKASNLRLYEQSDMQKGATTGGAGSQRCLESGRASGWCVACKILSGSRGLSALHWDQPSGGCQACEKHVQATSALASSTAGCSEWPGESGRKFHLSMRLSIGGAVLWLLLIPAEAMPS